MEIGNLFGGRDSGIDYGVIGATATWYWQVGFVIAMSTMVGSFGGGGGGGSTTDVTVMAFAFNLPARGRKVEVATLVVLTTMFTLCLILIRDIDRPFVGVISVASDALRSTEEHITGEYGDAYGQESLPCDGTGEQRSGT